MENNTQQRSSEMEQQSSTSYREILEFFWRIRWWIVGSMILVLAAGFLYVRMQTPIFQRTSWIMLNRNDGSNADLALLSTMTGRSVQKKIENEIYILKSPSLMQKVVEEKGLNMRYFQYGAPVGNRVKLARALFDVKRTEFYKNSPFEATIVQIDSLDADARIPAIYIEFKNNKGLGYTVRKAKVGGQEIDLPNDKFSYGEPMRIRNVEVNGKSSSFTQLDVVTLVYKDAVPRRTEDILNTLVLRTNMEARNYANLASVSTIQFIDTRLAELARELGAAESNYKHYQSSNVVLNLDSQSQLAMTSDMGYQNQLVDVRLQLRVLDMITDYLNEPSDQMYRVIPTNIGIADVGLNAIVANYNELVAERNRLVSNSSESNPRVLGLNTELEDWQQSIKISIANLAKVYKIKEKDLVNTLDYSKKKMSSIPEQQFEVQQLSRKINIIEPLYLMLQQKREESQIAMYSQADNFRLIEAAFGSSDSIAPNAMRIYMIPLLLGFCIPPVFVWFRMQLKTKVETKDDLVKKVDATVIVFLPKANIENMGVLIPKNGRDTSSESFRMLRSNLQYLPDTHVIQVTSSTPGEGKSFIASNLALSISHVGKRVLLIGLDIRKPALHKIFPDCKVEKYNTVVGYLIGKCTDLDALVVNSSVSPTLDLIFAGPVPPNPTELLSQGREGEMINYFRDKYDYVIIDSAPYLPVSDSFIINSYVDSTLYTVRADYTDLKLLNDINDAIHSKSKPIKNVNLVLNDLNLEATKYRYGYGAGYGYGYGYGHGYGYGYGYGNEDEHEKSRHHHRHHHHGSKSETKSEE